MSTLTLYQSLTSSSNKYCQVATIPSRSNLTIMARMAFVILALAAAIFSAQAVPHDYGYGYVAAPVYGAYGHGGYGHGYYADSVADVKVYQNPKHYQFDVVEKGKGFARYHHQQADTPYGYHYGGYTGKY